MIVGVCGFGYTGSGALIDLLKGYDHINVFDKFEFSFIYSPDGIDDLRYHLVDNPTRYMSSDIAINRFIKYSQGKNLEICKFTNNKYLPACNKFIDSLIQVKWRGYWMFDYFEGTFWEKNFNFRLFHARILKLLSRKTNKTFDLPPVRNMYLSVDPNDFDVKAKQFVSEIIQSINQNNEDVVVLNQPFRANNPKKDFMYFDNPKAIIVDRDPRDLYVILKKIISYKCRFIPYNDVDSFIKYYEALHKGDFMNNSNNTLYIKFEDLIYDFDITKSKIEKFLNIENSYSQSKSGFDPLVSIENTCIYDKYPDLSEDVELIEQRLSTWLYDFENKKIKPKGGKSYRELFELADK